MPGKGVFLFYFEFFRQHFSESQITKMSYFVPQTILVIHLIILFVNDIVLLLLICKKKYNIILQYQEKFIYLLLKTVSPWVGRMFSRHIGLMHIRQCLVKAPPP